MRRFWICELYQIRPSSSCIHLSVLELCVLCVLCGLIIPMQPEFILKLDRPHSQIIRQSQLLGAVSGDRKKVLTLRLTDKGKLDTLIKSSEKDAAHQT